MKQDDWFLVGAAAVIALVGYIGWKRKNTQPPAIPPPANPNEDMGGPDFGLSDPNTWG